MTMLVKKKAAGIHSMPAAFLKLLKGTGKIEF